MLNIFEKLFW